MRYGVLGSVEVRNDDGRIDLGGPQQRRLLAVLLSAPGRVFSIERLIDAMWSDGAAPEGASKALLTYMSRLRARIGSDEITTRDGGYLFDGGASTIDAVQFDELVKRARGSDPDTAVRLYDEALALWRGPAFGDFASEWWAIAHASRLEELRAVAAEERAATLIALGQAARAVPELEALLIEFPLRERVAQLSMQALDAVGRKAEALRVFQTFRQALIDNTGLDPSDELVALDKAIAASTGHQTATEGRPLRGYVLHEVIGRGAHGTVYAAKQPGTERDVAIKVVRAELADSPIYVRRFEVEAQLVARIEHPHVVPLYDFWREPGGAYLVFRLMRGGTAEASLITGGQWSLQRADRLVEQVGNALVTAHAAGVAHRDVRAANVLLDESDNMFICDFGIASQPDDDQPDADMIADMRDFATTVRELISGTDRQSPATALMDSDLAMPRAVDAVLSRALAAAPNASFESMAEFVLAWSAAVGTGGGVGPVGTAADRTSSDRRLAARQLSARARAGVNPYRGLRSFAEADAREYYGRTSMVDALCVAADGSPLVAVVGPSGCGKSSLVHAGLIPHLRERVGLLVTTMTPGTRPLAALHAALSVVSTMPLDEADPQGSIASVARQSALGLVLIIDQFEECWTLPDVAERDRFMSALTTASTADMPVSVVVTLRADMYDRPLQDPAIGALFGAATFPVTPMSAAELEDAVRLPAARAQVGFEDGVVSSIVTETASNPGSLPMLQFALFDLFERRVDGCITAAAYQALGGVAGALAGRADDLYLRSSIDDQEHIRQLFQRLVNPGEGVPDSRRRALIGDLPERTRLLADQFVTTRLLVLDHDRVTREPTVEVAHEAILTRWTRLASWIDDDRRWLAQLHHLTAAARACDDAGRPAAELYRGSRLEAALECLPRRQAELTPREIDFVEAGQQARDSYLQQERRSAVRLRRALVGVALLLVVATVSAAIAVRQRRTADRSTSEARIGALVGDIASIRRTQRDTAALLAIEAFRLEDTPATRSALLSTFTSTPGFLDTNRLGDNQSFFAGAVMPDGGGAFVIDPDNLVRPYDLNTGAVGEAFPRALPAMEVVDLNGAGNHPAAANFSQLVPSPDGALLAQLSGTLDANDVGTTSIAVFDASTGHLLGTPIHVDRSAGTLAFSPDGSELIVTGGTDGTAIAFDTATGNELARLTGTPPDETIVGQIWITAGLAFLDSDHLAIGSVADSIRIVDPKTLADISAPIAVPANSARILFALDSGKMLLGIGRNRLVRVDVSTGGVVWSLDSADISVAACAQVAVAATRSTFYCGDAFGRLEERSLADGSQLRQLDAQNGAAGSLWVTRNGTELVSFGDNERVVSRFRLDGSGPITQRIAPGLAGQQYSPNGTMLIGRLPLGTSLNDSVDDNYVVLDPSSGGVIQRLGSFNFPFWNTDESLGGVIIGPEGFRLAAYQLDTHVAVPLDYVFTRQITQNVNNTGQPKAWVGVPNDDDTSEIWTFERPTGRRVEPTVTVTSLVSLTGSPDGRRFAVATATGVQVFDGETGASIARIDNRPDLRGVYFVSNDVLAISSLGGDLLLHDVDTLQILRTLNGSRGFVQDVQPTVDGALIAVDGGDRTVQLIDVASGTPIGDAVTLFDAEWNGVILQPQGLQMAVGGGTADGIAIWDLDPAHWVDAACRVAGRSLTQDEWTTYLSPLESYHQTCP